jgi:NADPH:quinone reductase-like Zn-dependent oxidoreductase
MNKSKINAKIPPHLSFEQAATLGVGISTVGQSLYMTLGMPLPTSPAPASFPVLIYAGASATGLLAIQYAKLSGLHVITTCSPANFDLVRGLGADEIFDYSDPECGEKIRKTTNNKLRVVMDCISTGSTLDICAAALSSDSELDLRYHGIKSYKGFPRNDVKTTWEVAYTLPGEAFDKMGHHFPAQPYQAEYGKMFWEMSGQLIADGKIKPSPVDLGEGGLEGVIQGLQDMADGKIRGRKRVYRVADNV